ncbi:MULTISPECIES: hypothetical protein [unclassified Streptomyces]|uniref:hypothetical protein n=1 Tax=unclassified Streptomyces TaxID=2593676 RepID=UPI003D8FE13C
MQDPVRLQGELLAAIEEAGTLTFGDLVETTRLPVLARAHATHLLWRRQLATDLGTTMRDGSPV